MTKPRLFLFVGYPGAGKTTVARLIAEATGAVHVWADYERHVMFASPTHSAEESRKLYDHLNKVAADLLSEGQSVIYDTNFNYFKDREHLRRIAAERGAETTLIWVTTDKPLAKRRATEESDNRHTRIWGNMARAVFERISGHLEPPREAEHPVKIDGRGVDLAQIKQLLNL